MKLRRTCKRLLLLATCACSSGDRECASPKLDASAQGAQMSASGATFGFGAFTSSVNNDCSVVSGISSVTVDGQQVLPMPAKYHWVLCLPRPDRIGSGSISLANADLVRVVNVSATDGVCSYSLDLKPTLAGTVTFDGFCTDGDRTYNLTFAGTATGKRRCKTDAALPTSEPITMDLSGTVSVHGE